MTACTILTITGDEQLLSLLRKELHDQNGGIRMIVASTVDEASTLLTIAEPRLIVLHWNGHGRHYEELNRLLWITSTLARPVPVLIIADRYRIDQATTLYRMGVTEYISRTQHRDRFGKLVEWYLHPAPSSSLWKPAGADHPNPVKPRSSMPTAVQVQVI